MNKYNVYLLGYDKKISLCVICETVKTAYSEFIKTYKKDCVRCLSLNKDSLICWEKKGNLFNRNGVKELIKFKRELGL